MDQIIVIAVIVILGILLHLFSNKLQKKGSKLGESKPMYSNIAFVVFFTVAILFLAFLWIAKDVI